MSVLRELAERVREAIPLTTSLSFEYRDFDGGTLTLTAPLEPNHNDKGTFFAGSQAALVTLAGWSLTTLLADAAGLPSDVVAVESELRYILPLRDDLLLRAHADDEQQTRFRDRLTRRRRAALTVTVTGWAPNGDTVCEFRGVYLARRPNGD